VVDVLAVIPARGGSKGLPGKNLRTVAGRTLVERAIDAAREASSVGRVVGSTDDPEIAAVMRAAGAEVPSLRPAELAADDTPDAPVFLHVLDELEATGYRPEIVVNVRPTAPLRNAADIDAAVAILLERTDCQSVKSVCLVQEHPYKMWTIADGVLAPLLPAWHERVGGEVDVARQHLPAVHRSNGAVDAVRCGALRAAGTFHPGRVAAYVMDRTRSVDVDSADDLYVAEQRLREEPT
jgi:CMP-N-acetylneuraminic acid synthetase